MCNKAINLSEQLNIVSSPSTSRLSWQPLVTCLGRTVFTREDEKKCRLKASIAESDTRPFHDNGFNSDTISS